jgi:hypothetical protein
MIDLLRENHHRPPKTVTKFLLAGRVTYPILFHQILSFFPQKTVDWLEPLLGTILEMLQALLVFGVSYGIAHMYWHTTEPIEIAFITSAIFAFTPLLLNRHVYWLSPRPFGMLLNMCAFINTVMYLLTDSFWFALGTVVFSALTGLSSKFGMQALIFILLGMSILNLDYSLILILGCGFTLALLISRGYYWQILQGHIRHSRFYLNYLADRNLATLSFNLKQIVLWPLILLRSPRYAIQLLFTHYVFISFSLFPWSVLLVISYFYQPRWLGGNVEQIFLSWYLAALGAMLLTSTKWLRFLGESNRYIANAVMPVCLLVTYRLIKLEEPLLWLFAGMLMLINIAGLVFMWISQSHYRLQTANSDREILYKWIKQQPASTILTIDLRLCFLMCFRTPHQGVNLFINVATGSKQEAFKRLIPKWYPFPAQDLWRLVREFDVNLLIVDRSREKDILCRDPTYVYDFTDMTEVYNHGSFTVFNVTKRSN